MYIIRHNRNIYKYPFLKKGMVRYRQVKKWGNSLIILLQSIDIKDLNVKEGDWIDIEEAIIYKSIPQELKSKT